MCLMLLLEQVLPYPTISFFQLFGSYIFCIRNDPVHQQFLLAPFPFHSLFEMQTSIIYRLNGFLFTTVIQRAVKGVHLVLSTMPQKPLISMHLKLTKCNLQNRIHWKVISNIVYGIKLEHIDTILSHGPRRKLTCPILENEDAI